MGSKNGIKSRTACFSFDSDQNSTKMESYHLKLTFNHKNV
jgi:hypothetical protein